MRAPLRDRSTRIPDEQLDRPHIAAIITDYRDTQVIEIATQ
jgi:hypothetical protein